jgi:hypothetical protein
VTFRSNNAKLEVYAVAVKWGEPTEDKTVAPPSREHYTWHTAITSEGGFARLFIGKDDPASCSYCKIIILVEANRGDKISVLRRQRHPGAKTSILEGKTYMEELRKGEADVYELTVPFNETEFSIDLRIRRGNLTFYYTMDETFANKNQLFVLPEKTRDEYFNINFGKMLFAIRQALGWTNKRYIKIEAVQDSDYELIVVSNNMVTELKPLVTKQSTVSTANAHFYYASVNVNEPIELSFHILNILNVEVGDFQKAAKYLNKFVRVYSVDTVAEVFKRKYKYQYKVDYQIFHHELRISLTSKTVFIVFEVINPMPRPVIYSLEMFRSGLKMLESNHQTADYLPNFGQKTFIYDVTESMKIARVEINQCLGQLKATYAFQSNKEQPGAPLKWERFYDSQLAKTSMDLREKGKLMIKFEKESQSIDDGTASQTSASQLAKDLPAVFSLNFFISDLDSSTEVNVERNYLIGDKFNYGNVEIYTDRDQTIKFSPLQLHDDNLYQTHHVMINYTLFMSKTEQMVDFMKSCDGFEIKLAEEAFGTTNHYSYSLTEEHRGTNSTVPKEYAFKPHTLTFGGIYHGILVADIRISKITVSLPLTTGR